VGIEIKSIGEKGKYRDMMQAVIFDLDGTLLDTLGDLGSAVNRVLARHGLPTHPMEAFRWFIGEGSAVLMTRALPPEERTPAKIEACLQDLLQDYGENWHTLTHPYEGIASLLQQLAQQRIRMSVVTNKPHRFAVPVTGHYFPHAPFACIFGMREGIPKKPDPFQALAAAGEMGVSPEACIFLGDSAIDMETARRAGMLAVGAGWGFRPRAELIEAGAAHIIEHPLDLLDLPGSRNGMNR
jgi:phosphoglycolate phosphatase